VLFRFLLWSVRSFAQKHLFVGKQTSEFPRRRIKGLRTRYLLGFWARSSSVTRITRYDPRVSAALPRGFGRIATYVETDFQAMSDVLVHAVSFEPRQVTDSFLCLAERRPTACTNRHRFDRGLFPLAWTINDAHENSVLGFLPRLGVRGGVVRTRRYGMLGTWDVRNDFDPLFAASNAFRPHSCKCA
jgi:hypothetical protein